MNVRNVILFHDSRGARATGAWQLASVRQLHPEGREWPMELNPIEEKIVRTYLSLRVEGVAAPSVTAVCREAGVSRTTFYEHFDGVEALLSLVEYAILHDVRRLFRDFEYIDLARFESPLRPIPMFVRVFEYVNENRLAFRLLFSPSGSDDFKSKYRKQGRDTIIGILSGEVDERDLQVTASMCVGCFEGLMIDWLEGRLEATPDQMALDTTRACLALTREWRRV